MLLTVRKCDGFVCIFSLLGFCWWCMA